MCVVGKDIFLQGYNKCVWSAKTFYFSGPWQKPPLSTVPGQIFEEKKWSELVASPLTARPKI